MALDRPSLETAIYNLLVAMNTTYTDYADQDDAFQYYAQQLSTAIDAFVKTGNAVGADAPTGDSHNLTIQ